jgi:hypothetical protein
MIKTEEFPKDRWDSYLTELTHEAKDHSMSVRVESLQLGDQILEKGLPLVEIAIEKKGPEGGDVLIIAERPDGSHLTHLIPDPRRIYLARYEDKHALCLDIEDGEGAKTLVTVYEGSA